MRRFKTGVTALLLALNFLSCEDPMELKGPESVPAEKDLGNQISFETVDREEAIGSIVSFKNRTDSKDAPRFDVDTSTIRYRELDFLDVELVEMDGYDNKTDNEVIVHQIVINGEHKLVVNQIVSKIGSKDQMSQERVLVTDLKGNPLRTWVDTDSGQTSRTNTFSDPCPPSICGINLEEVVVTAPSVPGQCYVCIQPNTFQPWMIHAQNISLFYQLRARLQYAQKFDDDIKDGGLKPCMKNVLDKLKDLKAGPGIILSRFDKDVNSLFKWKVKDGGLPANVNGRTSSVLSGGYATTTFDSKKFANATDLSVARTILHESVHAFLVIEFRNSPQAFSKSYPELIKEYNRTKKNFNDLQHEEFTRKHVGLIGGALEAFGKLKGYNVPRQYYDDLAWGGLTGTKAFKKKSPSEKNRILDVIQSEFASKDRNGNYKKPKGKKSGCKK
ncbi:hypothetical protein [Sediminicola luteus]|uniref:Uncharacterized protein n=1 Tax=Sediminicola luteus TaxID=319238 RepID=A0A2A4G363_9FLAO|nr:hypothetical protein [Sediminicola luteus]PCE63117.1 hypothetical protein B7P33_17770 [Sediminicola luteus]